MEAAVDENSATASQEEGEIGDSCFIVDEEPPLIEIESDSQNELKTSNGDGELPSEYEIIDQTFASDCTETVSVTNGSQSNTEETPKKSSATESQRILVDVKFRNKKTYLALNEEFIDAIKKCLKRKLDDLNIIDDAANNRLSVVEKLVKKSDAFLVDTTPSSENLTANESTPKYTSISRNALTFEKVAVSGEEKKSMSSAHQCFNCDKVTHSLRDCPEPRNMTKIRKARSEFNRKELRYLDEEGEFSRFTPGMLSEELREALGLTPDQIPLHVYKMRLYGYPPAWLEDAKVYNSGLSLFVEKDKTQSHDDENRSFKYDAQKIYEYPGFNVMPDTVPFVDKHRLLNLPSMQMRDSKEVFIQSLGDVVMNGYKKRKLGNIGEEESSTLQNQAEADMEIEASDDENDCIILNNSNPPSGEKETVLIPSRPQSPEEEGEVIEVESQSRISPSFDELQNERDQLLAQLNSTSQPEFTSSTQFYEDTILENSVNENLDNSSKDIQLGHVETTVFGATVLPSFSPFDTLPAGEKFKEGVSDVIAFENLAESTGKYEKMKGLIKKVRVFLKDHHKE